MNKVCVHFFGTLYVEQILGALSVVALGQLLILRLYKKKGVKLHDSDINKYAIMSVLRSHLCQRTHVV